MIRSTMFVLVCTLGAGAAPYAAAADDESRDVTYSGIGLSRVSTSFDNVKDAVALEAALGFRVPDVNWFGVELNLGFTVIPGEIEQSSSGTTGGSASGCGLLGLESCPGETTTTSSTEDFQAFTIGAFGVLRSPGRFYGMGKLGYRYINSNLPELDDERSGGAWGAGVGYRYNPAGGFAELAYTRLSDDLDYLGFALGFGF